MRSTQAHTAFVVSKASAQLPCHLSAPPPTHTRVLGTPTTNSYDKLSIANRAYARGELATESEDKGYCTAEHGPFGIAVRQGRGLGHRNQARPWAAVGVSAGIRRGCEQPGV